jgi:hypothetical protein
MVEEAVEGRAEVEVVGEVLKIEQSRTVRLWAPAGRPRRKKLNPQHGNAI